MSSHRRLVWPELLREAPCQAVLKARPEDFVVREVLAFEPSGAGDHLYLFVQKRSVSAFELVRRLAEKLGVAADDIGTAGLKDTQAVTEQWVSVPRTEDVERKVQDDSLWDESLHILKATPHGHKLRTGLLRGNDFEIRLRELAGDNVQQTLTNRWQLLGELGLLNRFGAQRFGREDNTLKLGYELLADPQRKVKRQLRRLALSAVQAALFNDWLFARLEEKLVHEVLLGDVMQVVASGGPFWADDIDEVKGRLAEKKVVVSGPIFGPKMRRARGDAAAREESVLSSAKLTLDDFAQHKKLCQGTRRAAVVWPTLKALSFEDPATAVLSFFLPAGSYATELVAALVDESNS